MKKIKITFVGFWKEFDPEEFFLTQIMRKYYDVEITENADYVICSGWEFYKYLGYDQVRIMFSGENYVPEFNFVDYAFSVYPIDFLDRHFSFPGLVLPSYDFLVELSKKDRNYSRDILTQKNMFANMIASHESENGLRGLFLKLLGEYKRVESAGSLYNNMPDGETVKMRDGSKLALQKKCKFTFCGESIAHEGFITEKIFDAFLADTIPIYYGSSTVSQIINKKAYIDVRDFDSYQAVVDRIIELDNNDDLYLEMLRQPIFVQPDYVEQKITELEKFIRNIFDQPLESAYRRAKMYMPSSYEKELLWYKKTQSAVFQSVKTAVLSVYWGTFDKLVSFKRRFIPPRKNQ